LSPYLNTNILSNILEVYFGFSKIKPNIIFPAELLIEEKYKRRRRRRVGKPPRHFQEIEHWDPLSPENRLLSALVLLKKRSGKQLSIFA
jgi:hypothetical protein